MSEIIKNSKFSAKKRKEVVNTISEKKIVNSVTDTTINDYVPEEYALSSDVETVNLGQSFFNTNSDYSTIINNGLNSILTEEWIIVRTSDILLNNINLDDYCETEEQRELIYCYLKNVDDCSAFQGKTLEEKLEIASEVMKYDITHGYTIIHSTPILMNGKVNTNINPPGAIFIFQKYEYEGEYLKYYNEYGVDVVAPLSEIGATSDGKMYSTNTLKGSREQYISQLNKYYTEIMKNSEQYSNKFKDLAFSNLKTICLAPIVGKQNLNHGGAAGGSWVAYVTGNEVELLDVSSNMIIDTYEFYDQDVTSYDYMVNAFTHELGHVYAIASGNAPFDMFDIDSSIYWESIYNQLEPYCDDQNGPLREYASSDLAEAFAECVCEYYGTDSCFNPEDLRHVWVDVGGVHMTLYDVMSHLLDD